MSVFASVTCFFIYFCLGFMHSFSMDSVWVEKESLFPWGPTRNQTLINTTESRFKVKLTCRREETLQPLSCVSSPWECCERSCLHKNMPLLWPWAGVPSVSTADDQSSALQRCSRFYLEENAWKSNKSLTLMMCLFLFPHLKRRSWEFVVAKCLSFTNKKWKYLVNKVFFYYIWFKYGAPSFF